MTNGIKILVFGKPRSGKTHFASKLATVLNAPQINGDAIRTIFPGLGFSLDDRMAQASRISQLCNELTKTCRYVVADFVCPTEATRAVFRADFTIWMNTAQENPYADTEKLFEAPNAVSYTCTEFSRQIADIDKVTRLLFEMR